MVGRVAPLVLVADSTALGVWTYLARVLLEEYTWQCSRSSVFCHGGKGSPSGALCRQSSSTVHHSIYYQTLLSVLCYHILDSLVCLFVVFMFHPVTQGNENQSINQSNNTVLHMMYIIFLLLVRPNALANSLHFRICTTLIVIIDAKCNSKTHQNGWSEQ